MENNRHDFFDGIQPKTSFVFGLASGTALILLLINSGIMGQTNGLIRTAGATGTTTGTTVTAPTGANAVAPVKTKTPTGTVPPITDQDHIRGDKNASITLVEYSDFECPFCKKFTPTLEQVLKEYEGKVRLAYRHFPLSFHANAPKEAEASDCAAELGGNDAFWEYHDAIFERTSAGGTGFALDALVPLAKELGLNEAKFKECLDSGKYAAHVQEDMAGGSAAGVTGTPGSFIIDAKGDAQLVSGALPFAQIKTLLDAALAK